MNVKKLLLPIIVFFIFYGQNVIARGQTFIAPDISSFEENMVFIKTNHIAKVILAHPRIDDGCLNVANDPPGQPGPIQWLPDIAMPFCPGTIITLFVDPVANATGYNWTLPPNVTLLSNANGSEITVRFDEPGTGIFQVTAVNAFGESPASVLTTLTLDPIETATEITMEMCPGDCVSFLGNTYCDEGEYEIVLDDAAENGCDSVILLYVIYRESDGDICADQLICLDDMAFITFTGNVSAGALFNWNFGGGSIISGNGSGPYKIQWQTAGTKIVTLVVEENGISTSHSIKIEVVEPPEPPEFYCLWDAPSGLQICWDDVPGAIGYSAVGINGTMGNFSFGSIDENCFSVVFPSDDKVGEASIELTIHLEEPCGDLVLTHTCQPVDCPPVVLSADPVGQVCLSPNASPILLNLNISGGNGGGTITWTGPGVTPNGIFSPAQAGIGVHTLVVTYEEGNCSWSTTMTLEVVPGPVITSIENQAPLFYFQQYSTIDLTMAHPGQYDFLWNGPNGFTYNQEDIDNWPNLQQGDYCVTVTNQFGCTATECVTVGPPILKVAPFRIICAGESVQLSVRPSNGIDFQWSPAAGLSCTSCANPIASPAQSTLYYVTATMPDGRTGTTFVFVMVFPPFFCGSIIGDDIAQKLETEILEDFEKHKGFSTELPDENYILEKIKLIENQAFVYPNPTKDKIDILSVFAPIQQVEIYDLSGKVILKYETEEQQAQMSLGAFLPGTYFVKIQTKNSVITKRVLLIQ